MNIAPIKTETDHAEALQEIRRLVALDPAPNSADAERLDILSTLVEAYEAKHFSLRAADAVDAIQFRMEQQGLAPRDIAPILGGRSKVSEVLSRKRPLTVTMMRALQDSLAIPASLLLRSTAVEQADRSADKRTVVIKEMLRRHWIRNEQEIDSFFGQLTSAGAVALRQGQHIRSARQMNSYALRAWITRVATQAAAVHLSDFVPGSLDHEFMRDLAQLSAQENGPAAAQQFIGQKGIALVVEPHLPQTYLDGAAVLLMRTRPIIGMTIRYDRLDNFWFTLMHELAHIALHFDLQQSQFIDDLDIEATDDPIECEADQLAGEALVPTAEWKLSPASHQRSATAALHLALRLKIHPAIVAGRMRHHWKAYRLLNNLVGQNQVRKWFPNIRW